LSYTTRLYRNLLLMYMVTILLYTETICQLPRRLCRKSKFKISFTLSNFYINIMSKGRLLFNLSIGEYMTILGKNKAL
jgi:hypothetical protein